MSGRRVYVGEGKRGGGGGGGGVVAYMPQLHYLYKCVTRRGPAISASKVILRHASCDTVLAELHRLPAVGTRALF